MRDHFLEGIFWQHRSINVVVILATLFHDAYLTKTLNIHFVQRTKFGGFVAVIYVMSPIFWRPLLRYIFRKENILQTDIRWKGLNKEVGS